MTEKNTIRSIVALLGVASACVLTGCGTSSIEKASAPVATQVTFQGRVHGGQQAVTGSTIQLYKANLNAASAYYGTSTPLISGSVTSDSNGNFSITSQYTCQAGDLLYLTATGGNPGISGTQNNSALAMMAGLGDCSTVLGTNRFVLVNELTTIATAWALAPFMQTVGAVDVVSTNVTGLKQAFAAIDKLVNTATGTVGGPALPTGATLPVNEMNTLADILAVCINTVNSNSTTQSTQCTNIFSATGSYAPPTDTIGLAIYLAHNHAAGLSLYSMATANAPFQPTLSAAPTDWTIAINYLGGGLSAPKGIAVDYNGNVWVANSGGNSVTELSNSGAAISGTSGFNAGAMSAPVALAVDLNNNIWVANSGNSTITQLTNSGSAGTPFLGGGLNVPKSIAIDANNNVWVANYGNSSVSQFTNSGTALSPVTGYTGAGISQPSAIAIDPQVPH